MNMMDCFIIYLIFIKINKIEKKQSQSLRLNKKS